MKIEKVLINSLRVFCLVLTMSARAEDSLVILTSFSESVFLKFEEGFKLENPNLRLKFVNKKTAAALDHIDRELKPRPDLFMASSIDAFIWLEQKRQLLPYSKREIPILTYVPFAFSGYGVMYNNEYLVNHDIRTPENWMDLLLPQWQGHIGMSSPTRSGTTHVIVESILQEHGWEGGWRYLLELAGNLATITARSFGVQQGILKKRFGAGPTIDSFAFVEITSAHEIGFVYPKKTVVLPVQIAIVRGTAQSNNARRFIEYLLTEAGQKLLLDPAIRRFPLDTKLLQEEQAGILQHYYQQLPKNLNYDADLSQQRYEVVNFLFDQAITRRLLELKIFWQHYHSLQSSSQAGGSLEALELLIQAKNLITQVPISADSVAGGEIQLAFQPYHSGITIPFGQQKIQKQWQLTMQENYSQAMDTLVQAAQVLGIDLRNIKKVKK